MKISILQLNVDPFVVAFYLMPCSWGGEDTIMVRRRESIDILFQCKYLKFRLMCFYSPLSFSQIKFAFPPSVVGNNLGNFKVLQPFSLLYALS